MYRGKLAGEAAVISDTKLETVSLFVGDMVEVWHSGNIKGLNIVGNGRRRGTGDGDMDGVLGFRGGHQTFRCLVHFSSP